MITKKLVNQLLRKNGKVDFICRLHPNARILDIGCGNNSSFHVKSLLPGSVYTGIDVADYNQTKPSMADNYVVTTPQTFAATIANFRSQFDAVISSHNLEHCLDRRGTLDAMVAALKPGGSLYLSFPCAESTRFPKRDGTLNYADDPTHLEAPPDFDEIMQSLKESGCDVAFATRRFRPPGFWLIGLLLEPVSALRRRVMRGTWELYGFESVIIAKRIRCPNANGH